MKRQQFTISDVAGTTGQDALDSYNAALLDPKREFGTPISGEIMAKAAKTPAVIIEAGEVKAKVKKVKAVDVSSSSDQKRGWKTVLAAETIAKAGPVGKAAILTILMDTLNISKANANVYYTKIQAKSGK